MNRFVNWTAVWLAAILYGSWFNAAAQLASAHFDGLQIQVASIHRSGDARDLDGSIGFKFTGQKVDRAISLSRVKIIQAIDDTGLNLVRTNEGSGALQNWQPTKTDSRFWRTVGALKAPAPGAKTIRHLEAEVTLFTPTANPPVLTNFMSQPGVVLPHVTLDQYQIQIRYDRETHQPPPPGSLIIDNSAAGKNKGKTILLKVDDPQHKLIGMVFQKADGGILPTAHQSQNIHDSQTEFSYAFQEAPPHDLNLVVHVASPEKAEKVRFSMDHIRLPWVALPALEVTAEAFRGSPSRGTNPYTCYVSLNFTGGQLTNALGIRRLWISQAEDDFGRPVQVRWNNAMFDALPPVQSDGRYVRKQVPLVFQSRYPKTIRILKGEAELVCPRKTNDYIITVQDVLAQTGKPLESPLLNNNHVKLTYLGQVNYAARRSEFIKTNWVTEQGGFAPKEVPSNTPNSVMFALDDPDNALIAPWANSDFTFLDANGQPLAVTRVMRAGGLPAANEFHVYRFKTLPPLKTQLRLYLAVPESLQRVPFQIKNIELLQSADSR